MTNGKILHLLRGLQDYCNKLKKGWVNGRREAPLEQILKLSDAFAGEYDKISLDLINNNYHLTRT